MICRKISRGSEAGSIEGVVGSTWCFHNAQRGNAQLLCLVDCGAIVAIKLLGNIAR